MEPMTESPVRRLPGLEGKDGIQRWGNRLASTNVDSEYFIELLLPYPRQIFIFARVDDGGLPLGVIFEIGLGFSGSTAMAWNGDTAQINVRNDVNGVAVITTVASRITVKARADVNNTGRFLIVWAGVTL